MKEVSKKLLKTVIILVCIVVFMLANYIATFLTAMLQLPNGDGSQNKYFIDLLGVIPIFTIPITLVNLFLSKIGFMVHKSEIIYKICKIICGVACLLYIAFIIWIFASHILIDIV